VALSGAGEPFFNPDLLDIVRYASTRGADVLTTTNFTMCSNRLEEIVDSGLSLIKISLDAAKPETYLAIRGKDFFSKILEDIERLQQVKAAKHSATPFVRLQFVLQSDNLPEIEEMVRLAHRLKANSMYFQPLETLLIQERKEDLARGVELARLRELLEGADIWAAKLGIGTNAGVLVRSLQHYYRKYEPGIPPSAPERVCLLPWFSLYISVDGDVRPCCSFAEAGTVSLGNIFEQSFGEIWNGEGYQRIRQQALDRNLNYVICRNCTPNRLRDFVSLSAVLPGFAKPGPCLSE
jgi:radical SAM protein with 4Fe4S-binding SPASM domain